MNINTYQELLAAIEAGEKELVLTQSLVLPNGIHLKQGQSLIGQGESIFLSVLSGDGIGLTGDNRVEGLAIQVAPQNRAIYLASTAKDLGTLSLHDLTVTGMVQLMMRPGNHKLNLDIDKVHVAAADTRAYSERPMKYGVVVHQGAFTVYNFNPDPTSLIQGKITNVSVGQDLAPVIGSGIFLSGWGDQGGQVVLEQVTTGSVYSNGMIPTGQPNLITGGIFIVYGARVQSLRSSGPVVTYGTNDMVLDVWGHVDDWLVEGTVTSYGTSGIGFVNFGRVDRFKALAPFTTYGGGARGFNQYDGTIGQATFESITTYGNGSIGMQFSKPVGKIQVVHDVTTHGSVGQTLVKGVIMDLAADGISVLEGGSIEDLSIGGNLVTHGEGVTSYHLKGGHVNALHVGGQILAHGKDSQAQVLA